MKNHAFRIKRGEDLLLSIKKYVEEQGILAGTVISGVGCVLKGRIRDASGVNIREIPEHMEIVSLMGTVSCNRTHLHIACSKEDLSTIGGHLVEGCIVNTTAEVVIVELDGMEFQSEFDSETGYNELVVIEK